MISSESDYYFYVELNQTYKPEPIIHYDPDHLVEYD